MVDKDANFYVTILHPTTEFQFPYYVLIPTRTDQQTDSGFRFGSSEMEVPVDTYSGTE